MILECTECRSRYLVAETAIGPNGRMVRCANCKHSWFQPPAQVDPLAATVTPSAHPTIPIAQAPLAAAPRNAGPDEYDAFAHRPPFRPRRNPARRYMIAAVAAGVTMLIAVGVILYSDAPGIAAQFGFSETVESPLRIEQFPIDRRELENKSELFAVSGRILNPTSNRQPIPDIRVELRDAQKRIVYSWIITPQQRVLAPGGTLDFNSAKLDVPQNSKTLYFSFSSGSIS